MSSAADPLPVSSLTFSAAAGEHIIHPVPASPADTLSPTDRQELRTSLLQPSERDTSEDAEFPTPVSTITPSPVHTLTSNLRGTDPKAHKPHDMHLTPYQRRKKPGPGSTTTGTHQLTPQVQHHPKVRSVSQARPTHRDWTPPSLLSLLKSQQEHVSSTANPAEVAVNTPVPPPRQHAGFTFGPDTSTHTQSM